jgi:hypothetical protein
MPFSIASGILMVISAGLISSFKVDTSTGQWISYQIIGGFGQGLGMMMVRDPLILPNNMPDVLTRLQALHCHSKRNPTRA